MLVLVLFIAPTNSEWSFRKLILFCNVYIQVMDQRNNKCLTLILDNGRPGEFHNSIQNPQNKQSEEIGTVHTWKLKWFSEEASLKFISVIKALYSTAATSSLHVKCIS